LPDGIVRWSEFASDVKTLNALNAKLKIARSEQSDRVGVKLA